MSESENRQDSNAGADGGSRRQAFRGESEWRDLLRRAERETVRFLKFYEETFAVPEDAQDDDRMDRCAVAMGWHVASGADDEDDAQDDEADDAPASGGNGGDAEAGSDGNAEPDAQEFAAVYSLHNLPESIAVSAIYRFARERWNRFLRAPLADKIPARAAAALAESLASAHRDLLLAIDAEDAMEFGLAVCLTKNAHAALNRHFAEMENVPAAAANDRRTVAELRCALMDLRDICLRILRASRVEIENAGGEK